MRGDIEVIRRYWWIAGPKYELTCEEHVDVWPCWCVKELPEYKNPTNKHGDSTELFDLKIDDDVP